MDETQPTQTEELRPVQFVFVFPGPLPPEFQPAITSLTNTLNAATGVIMPNKPVPESKTNHASDEDPWLGIDDAADYLGARKSTLYKYRCEGSIESRKLCGRIQFRRSALDRFKADQIRPARQNHPKRRRIALAPGSGK